VKLTEAGNLKKTSWFIVFWGVSTAWQCLTTCSMS